MKERAFSRRFEIQAVRMIRRRHGGLPFFSLYHGIPGFFYLGVGPVAIWRDGWRLGIGGR